jgi:predicted DCC family thiol-disulfide oxidoreductase YuxK
MNQPILFFDGVCNLCNGFVDFLIRHDRARTLRYASLQGETAKRVLRPEQIERLESVVLYENGRNLEKSDAVLRSLELLGGPWRLAAAAMMGGVPRSVRDGLYFMTAKNRYGIFGKRDRCRLPTPEERSLFLD